MYLLLGALLFPLVLILALALGAIFLLAFRCRGLMKRLRLDLRQKDRVVAAMVEIQRPFPRFIESAADAILLHDLEGNILNVNESVCELLGYTRMELLGMAFSELDKKWDAHKGQSMVEALRKRQSATEEQDWCSKHGGEVPVEVKSSLLENDEGTLLLVFARDVSSRRDLETWLKRREDTLLQEVGESKGKLKRYMEKAESMLEALCLSEERLELVAIGARVGIWDTDCQTLEVYWSAGFSVMLGYEDGEITDDFAFFDNALHDEDRETVLGMLQRHMNNTGMPFDVEGRLQRKNGDYRWYRITGQAQWGGDGRPLRLAGGITDIQEKKDFELAIIEAKEAALTAAKARGEFLANMSHEIRTPMTAILGFTDLLEDPGISQDEFKDRVQTIRRNGEHLLSLINDILDISKLEAGKMNVERVDCSLKDLVGEVLTLMQVRAQGKGVSLVPEFLGEIPERIQSDPTRIRQILMNLVGNALKFTERGEVKIRVHCPGRVADGDVADGDVADGDVADGDTLRFEVEDTGIGIPADRVESLFESFTQADSSTTRKFGGTGLGLTICKRLAILLDGDILVESEEGRGSCFTFALNLMGMSGLRFVDEASDTSMTEVATRESQVTKPIKGKKKFLLGARVLLAEDGPDNQRLIRFQLEKVGAEVEVAENGLVAYEAALEAQRQGQGFDLILMDMQMPEMDGYTATGKLREEGYEGPIIALTAHAMSGDRDKCIAAGCDDYATKPLVRKVFYETLRRHFIQPEEAVSSPRG